MATNKRKEAAALFELIDQSTLKVPKNAGSLKIPAWWSSKTNPPGNAVPSNPSPKPIAKTNGFAPAAPVPLPVARPNAPVAPEPSKDEPLPADPDPIQPRLFDPPGSSAIAPSVSPSIRPPAMNAGPPAPSSSPTFKAPAPVLAVAEPAARPIPKPFAPATANAARTPQRVFAPNTGQGTFARVPPWVMLAGVAAVIVIITCMILILHNSKKESAAQPPLIPKNDGSQITAVATSPGGPGTLVPRGQPQPAPAIGQTLSPPGNNNSTPAGVGHVYLPGTISRSPDLLYIIVAQSPSRDISERNAKFIADNGVDVSVEFTSHQMYAIISVKGFSSRTEVTPLLKQVVDIGHLTDDYKKNKKAWDDAYATKLPTSIKTAVAPAAR